jgi:5-methylcytosine-specific restriction endonuclease McrA
MQTERTLLLSQGYQPLGTIPWQRAVSLLTLGKVEVVEEYDVDIRSVYLVIRMPAVVRLITRFRRHKQRVKFSRQNVLARDRWRCQYCGQKKPTAELTYDHVIPRSQGGKTCWENIVTACEDCNSRKADRTPAQAGMKLRSKPERPTWVPVFTIQLSTGSVPDQWASYLYWHSEIISD